MPGFTHEAEVALFRNRPALARELLATAFGLHATPGSGPLVEDAELAVPLPANKRVDIALVERMGGQATCGLLVEIQQDRDPEKEWSWPYYVATERARLKCRVLLVVVALDPGVARWATRAIPLGHPGFTLTPLVIGPAQIPRVADLAAAMANPELAVLSALVHGEVEDPEAVAHATLEVVRGLDDEPRSVYVELLASQLNAVTRRIMELLMNQPFEVKSEFGRHVFALGEARGEARGKAEGEAHGILTVLRGRGLTVSDALEARILACTDLAVLDRWLLRAIRIERADEVLTED